MALLTQTEISDALSAVPEWSLSGNEIVREFDREDFVGSVKFVDSLVAPAERLGHHPDITISWSNVEVRISTHSEGGLTGADFELAAEIDRLA